MDLATVIRGVSLQGERPYLSVSALHLTKSGWRIWGTKEEEDMCFCTPCIVRIHTMWHQCQVSLQTTHFKEPLLCKPPPGHSCGESWFFFLQIITGAAKMDQESASDWLSPRPIWAHWGLKHLRKNYLNLEFSPSSLICPICASHFLLISRP
jgi:hypothetical protein